jgi:ubiquinone/menaquinone biosynthesis C-methylase UbiE
MPEIRPAFDDADAYERYMGGWSRAVGERFLDWLAPPPHARWLDVGCGTGAFGALVVERCAPARLSGIDPSAAQVAAARKRLPQADLRAGDAMALPFGTREFDVVASALVLHFIPDRGKAFAEMKRVAAPDGIVAGYTWERTPEASGAPYAPMLRGIRSMGLEPLRSPTVPEQTLEGLHASLAAAGFSDVVVTRIEAVRSFSNFDEYWEVQTLTVAPIGKMIAGFDAAQRDRLREIMRAALPVAADGSISYPASAVAFKARA